MINQTILEALAISEHSKVPTLFLGNPGVGKTTTVFNFCLSKNYKLKLIRGSEHQPDDILGIFYNSGNQLEKLLPEWAVDIKKDLAEDPTVKHLIFIDELTTCSEPVQAALLNLIFNREVGEFKLPDNTLIACAGNYSANLGSGFTMLAPLLNRFSIINLKATTEDVLMFLSRYKEVKVNPFELDITEPVNITQEMKSIIELAIHDVTVDLSSQNLINLNNTELNDLYTGNSTVMNFISFRSLNYLLDITISLLSLGYALSNPTYRNMVQGLVGAGTGEDPRMKDKNKSTEVRNSNFTSMYIDGISKYLQSMSNPTNKNFKIRDLIDSSSNEEFITTTTEFLRSSSVDSSYIFNISETEVIKLTKQTVNGLKESFKLPSDKSIQMELSIDNSLKIYKLVFAYVNSSTSNTIQNCKLELDMFRSELKNAVNYVDPSNKFFQALLKISQ